jgi:hypothetical protein
MRSPWVRWATCALAVSIFVPAALADRGTRSVSNCTSFDQIDKSDDTVQFTITNSCTVPVDCSLSWRVVCAPSSKKRRAVHPSSKKFALDHAASQTAEASATICGDDSWSIESIQWSCAPNPD